MTTPKNAAKERTQTRSNGRCSTSTPQVPRRLSSHKWKEMSRTDPFTGKSTLLSHSIRRMTQSPTSAARKRPSTESACVRSSRAEYVTTGHGRCIAKRGNMINFMQYMSKIMQIMYGFMRKGVFDGEHTCRKSRSICQQLCSVCMNSCRRSFWRIKERFTSEPFPHIPPTRICTPLRRHPCNRTTSRVRAPRPRRFSLLTRSSGPPPHQTLSRPSCS